MKFTSHTQDSWGGYSGAGRHRNIGLDWHVWKFFSHFFRWVIRHASAAGSFCDNQARNDLG
jgi:hypothetical protein